jgi:hypothetical protein
MIDWLRRRICRCPEPEPMLQVTGYTGGFVGGPYMEVHIGGSADDRPMYDQLVAAEREFLERPRRHLHAVPDETE